MSARLLKSVVAVFWLLATNSQGARYLLRPREFLTTWWGNFFRPVTTIGDVTDASGGGVAIAEESKKARFTTGKFVFADLFACQIDGNNVAN